MLIPNDRFLKSFSWQFYFFRVFVRKLLSESHRNIFSYFVWHEIFESGFESWARVYWAKMLPTRLRQFYRKIPIHVNLKSGVILTSSVQCYHQHYNKGPKCLLRSASSNTFKALLQIKKKKKNQMREL